MSVRKRVVVKSPVRKNRSQGAAGGASGNRCSYPNKNKNIFQAGISKVKITPPLDVRLAGFGKRLSSKEGDFKPRSVHDDLYVKALVLEQGSQVIVLVVCDLTSLDAFLVDKVRKKVNEKIGIPSCNILLAGTHTHSGPAVREGVVNDIILYGDINHQWKDKLFKLIVQAIVEAFENRCPAEIGFASGEVTGVAHTRRLKLSSGQIFNPSGCLEREYPGTKVIGQGPCDNELGVICLRNSNGKPLAVILNYANHPWIAAEMFISAEISGKACQIIEKEINQGVVAMLFNGAGGDASVGATRRSVPQSDEERLIWWDEEQERFGRKIAQESLRVLEQISDFDAEPGISAGYSQLALEIKPLKDLIPIIRRSVETLKKIPNQKLLKNGKIVTEVLAFKIGDAVILGLPGEILCKLGMDIKEKSGYKKTYVFGYCYDYIFYIPPKSYYSEGGYEVDYAVLEQGGGEKLRDAALKLIEEFNKRN